MSLSGALIRKKEKEMADLEKEVKQEPVDPSATEQTEQTEQEQKVVTDPAIDQQETAEATETTTETPITQTETGEPQVDENGVPWKNRAYEWKRKSEDLAEKLPTLIQDAVSKSIGQQQPQQQYSVEQLEAFAEQTENPAYKQWAKSELRKLDEEKTAKLIRGEFEKIQKTQQAENTKRQSYQYVAQNYPEAFLKDTQGNLNWNPQHPLTRMIGQLMENPDLKGRPDALAIASDIAYGRYARMQGSANQQKNQQLKREVKTLQKRTLVEGGGRDTTSIPAHRVAIDRLKQTDRKSVV